MGKANLSVSWPSKPPCPSDSENLRTHCLTRPRGWLKTPLLALTPTQGSNTSEKPNGTYSTLHTLLESPAPRHPPSPEVLPDAVEAPKAEETPDTRVQNPYATRNPPKKAKSRSK